jgi:hypothetical protein
MDGETIKAAAAICDNWLEVYGSTNPQFVTPQDWACDAIRDIADAIRKLPVNDK